MSAGLGRPLSRLELKLFWIRPAAEGQSASRSVSAGELWHSAYVRTCVSGAPPYKLRTTAQAMSQAANTIPRALGHRQPLPSSQQIGSPEDRSNLPTTRCMREKMIHSRPSTLESRLTTQWISQHSSRRVASFARHATEQKRRTHSREFRGRSDGADKTDLSVRIANHTRVRELVALASGLAGCSSGCACCC